MSLYGVNFMRNLEIDQSGINHGISRGSNQPQELTQPVIVENISNVFPDSSAEEIPPFPDSAAISTLDNNSQFSGLEARSKRRDRALRQAQERLNRTKEIFGKTEEEQKANFEREYHKAGGFKKFSESLAGNGILLSMYRLRGVADSLNISRLRADAPANKPRVKEESGELVGRARKQGLIEKLPLSMQKVLNERYPQEGEPRALEKIGKDMEITRERVRQKEATALRRIRRLLEGKRQTVSRSRDDIEVAEIARLYTEENKTVDEISELFVCDRDTVLRRLNSCGISMRPKGPRVKYFNTSEAISFLNEGKSISEIVRLLNSSEYIVLNRLRNAGQQIPSPSRPRKK